MARNSRIFADLDINFRKHPATDDVTMRYDEEAIKQSIKNLVMTNHYERPFHPEIGSQLRALLFEPASPLLVISLKQSITNTINNFEPICPKAPVISILIIYLQDILSIHYNLLYSHLLNNLC